jgi:hypothetical protein
MTTTKEKTGATLCAIGFLIVAGSVGNIEHYAGILWPDLVKAGAGVLLCLLGVWVCSMGDKKWN